MFQADFWKKFSFGRFWPFFAIFGHFWPKNQVFELFLQNRTSEFYITCSKARNNCFNHLTVVLCLGKFSFWPFWPIFGKKYIACGDKLRFLTIFDQFFPVCWCLFDNFCFLNQVYGLRRDKVSLGCDKKIFGHFWTFFGSKFWQFLLKNQVFGCFLENRLSEFHVTWSETRDNCFQSVNGSVVSGKINIIN